MASNPSTAANMASSSNPCCSALQAKYAKMAERRTLLRNGMEILEGKIKSMEIENLNLQKAFQDQQNRADVLEEEKAKEASLRTSLEDEVAALKSKICSNEADTNCKNELEKETLLLRECISQKEGEIQQLKKLLEEGNSGPVKGKKVSPSDKKKIAELQKNLKSEKNRADEACELVDAANRKSEEDRNLVETLNNEIAALKSRICSTEADVNCKNNELEKESLLLRECISEKEGEIEQLKKLLEEGNSGSVKGKKISPTDKKKIAELQKNLKSEKKRADEACKLVDEAKRKSEEDENLVETLNNEVKSITQKLEETNRMFETERQSAVVEKKKADEEQAKANELRKIAEVNEKKAADEKFRADNLSISLEEEKKKFQILQKELHEVTSNQNSALSSQLDELKKILEIEKEKVIVQKKCAEHEKFEKEEHKKAVEASMEKAMEEKRRADKLLEDLLSTRLIIENLQQELTKVNHMLEAERLVSAKEKQRADDLSLKSKAAEASMEKAMEEKRHADKLLEDLLNTRLIIENLQQELTKVNHMLEAERLVSAKEKQRADDLSLKSKEQQIAVEVEMSQLDKLCVKLEEEKKKVASEKKRADLEMSEKEELKKAAEAIAKKAMEEKHLADKLSQDLQCGRDRIESLEVDLKKVNVMLDEERLVLAAERNHADALKSKLEEQARIATENEKRAMEEESRSNKMVQELENARQKLRDVEIQLCEVKQRRDLAGASSTPTELLFNKQMSAKVSFLQEQLKFEKKRVKHYKEVAKLEKDLKNASQQELHNVKQDFQSLLYQMDMLSDTFGARNHMNKKRRLNAGGLELPGRTPDCGLPQLNFCCDAERRPSSLSSRDTSCRPKPNSRLVDAEQPMESPSASFSDEQLLGSQERAACTPTTLTRLTIKDPVPQTPIAKWNDCERIATVAENSINPVEFEPGHVKKRRKIIDESEVVRCVELQDKINNQDAETNLFGLGKVLVPPMKEQMEKVNLLVTGNNAYAIGNFDLSEEKKKATNEPQQVLQQVNNSTVLNGNEISQPNESHRSGLVVPDLEVLNLGMPVCARNIATDLNGEHDKIPKFCVVYSDMEDIGCITRIFCTTTTCMARLRSSLQKPWLVEDILLALVSEQDLVSREMICVFFSLLLLNFASASCTKFVDFQSLLSDTLCANLQSVLLNMDRRHLFAKVCCLSDFLSLSENFLLHKKILLRISLTSDTLNCGDSNIEILHQGESNVLRSSLASTNMVVAGSLILASISAAAGLVDSICEFSLKVIGMRRADCLMTLLILHTFAYVCGEEYFTISNYHVVMEAVKVIVASLEGSLAINGTSQPDDGTLQHCFPCEKCPFADRSICLDDVSSKLIEEMQAFTDPHNQADTFDSRFLVAILSALELLATHMSWGWVCDKVVSKLLETVESCDPESIMSTAVVTLLGDLGRLGVETRGYDDPGVRSIIQRLSASLHKASSSKHNTFSMTVVHSLTQLHPNGAEVFLKNNEESVKGAHPASSTATSDILRTMFSSLSNKPTSALHNCVIPDIIA
ncbi:uncharacterized protein LOC141657155 isoform X2 [Silene latifolia]|uniref:uncharacterized protein LOC141657155 isoform X2 n=1 Tax=Silene latifolia TaxID=37657 RepID=UPI003D7737B2